MKFGFLTINHNRPKVLHLWLSSMNRIRSALGDFPIVCVSGQEDAEICNQYNVHHIAHINHPMTYKWNRGMMWLREQELDYICISGSDDIFSSEALANIIVATESAPDMIGFQSLYIYCAIKGTLRGRMKHITTKGVFGVGKTLSKGVLDAVNWSPWDYDTPRSWGTDSILARNTSQYIHSKVIVDGVVVDVKTNDNLNKFTMFERNRHGVNADKSLFYNILGEEEKKILAEIEGSVPSLDHWVSVNSRNNLT